MDIDCMKIFLMSFLIITFMTCCCSEKNLPFVQRYKTFYKLKATFTEKKPRYQVFSVVMNNEDFRAVGLVFNKARKGFMGSVTTEKKLQYKIRGLGTNHDFFNIPYLKSDTDLPFSILIRRVGESRWHVLKEIYKNNEMSISLELMKP